MLPRPSERPNASLRRPAPAPFGSVGPAAREKRPDRSEQHREPVALATLWVSATPRRRSFAIPHTNRATLRFRAVLRSSLGALVRATPRRDSDASQGVLFERSGLDIHVIPENEK